jgi:hypothetical protein
MMEVKYFTLESANEVIPFLTSKILQMRKIKSEIMQMAEVLEKNGMSMEALFKKSELTEEQKSQRLFLERLGDEINDVLFEIQERGAFLKDIEQGLVDFHTKIAGEEALLCWKFGEPEIAYWHDLESGFSGRKSLFTKDVLESVTKLH